jgi:DNA polymerase-3 subunit chi
MFDGGDATAVEAARGRWKSFKEAGYPLAYWQQNDRGGWEKQQG